MVPSESEPKGGLVGCASPFRFLSFVLMSLGWLVWKGTAEARRGCLVRIRGCTQRVSVAPVIDVLI